MPEPRDQPPGGIPLQNIHCPLCGGPNACAVARCGSFDTPCWCRDARIPPDVLARIPPAQRGIACVCARCAAPVRGEE